MSDADPVYSGVRASDQAQQVVDLFVKIDPVTTFGDKAKVVGAMALTGAIIQAGGVITFAHTSVRTLVE